MIIHNRIVQCVKEPDIENHISYAFLNLVPKC